MRYFKVPIINGELDLDYLYLHSAIATSETEAYVKLQEGFTMRPSWEEIPEEAWLELEESVQPAPVQIEPVETAGDRLTRLEEQNLVLMDALATTFEEVLALRTIVEGGTAE